MGRKYHSDLYSCPTPMQTLNLLKPMPPSEDFPSGYALYAFDLTPDMCGSFNVVQKGNCAIDVQFAAAPAVSVVCYG